MQMTYYFQSSSVNIHAVNRGGGKPDGGGLHSYFCFAVKIFNRYINLLKHIHLALHANISTNIHHPSVTNCGFYFGVSFPTLSRKAGSKTQNIRPERTCLVEGQATVWAALAG